MTSLLTVLVSFNRLELLQRTVESYKATVTLPHRLIVVDNNSGPNTIHWLRTSGLDVRYLPENRYPGFAANFGWEAGLSLDRADLLHRSDNDVEFLPGWCDEVVRMFDENPTVGQVGLRTLEEEGPHAAVGGNAVIRRQVWDAGVRYGEAPWGAVAHEDAGMSQAVLGAGFGWARVERPCVVHTGVPAGGDYAADPYYQETFRVRGVQFP